MFFLLLMLGVFVLGIQNTFAYTAIINTPTAPYEIKEIERPLDNERWYLSTLVDYPHMYELTLVDDTSLVLSLRIPADTDIEAMRPALLLVQSVESQGVDEIMRMDFESTQWQEEKDVYSGLSYYTTEPFIPELPAGKYRIEISSASDEGKYMLVVGSDDEEESFGTAWETVGTLYDFYGVSSILKVRSPLVQYPLGILILLGLTAVTWRYRTRLRLR